MVSADGFAKVLDFGLAKLTEKRDAGPDISKVDTEEPTREGAIVGTAGYMSPEQVQGKPVDHRSDIFSFGCVLYEATTRRRPFQAESSIETLHKILNEKPTPVEELNSKAPAELRRLIRRCLAKSPEQRLQSMKDLALELREIVDEYESLSASASSGSAASGTALPSVQRRRSVPIWAGAAVVALLGIGLALELRRERPQGQPFQSMRLSTQTSRGDVIDSALSPDGRYLAYLAARAGSAASLRVRQVATGSDVEVLPAGEAHLQDPSFSPDGNYIFYTAIRKENDRYRDLFQVPSLGGAPRPRASDVDTRVSFAPDGKRLAFWRGNLGSSEARLVVLDLDSGKEKALAEISGQEGYRGGPSWSPDGKRIAGIVAKPAPDLSSTIALFDAETGQRQDLVELSRTQLQSLAWLRDGAGIVSTGTDLNNSLMTQVHLHSYPGGRSSRITNDFNRYLNISAARSEDTIAAQRNTTLGNFWLADAAGAPARRLTSITNPENSPGNPVTGNADTIVYQAPEDRTLHIWSLDVAKGEPRRLTSGDALSINPRAAQDVVVFDRMDATGMHVWRMGLDGSAARVLTSGAGEQAIDFSSDGRYVVHMRYDAPKTLVVASAEDGRAVFSVPDATGSLGFSPDAKSVLIGKPEKDAAGLGTIVWRVFPVGGGAPTATIKSPGRATNLRVAPDGLALTFLNPTDPASNVYRQGIDGGPVAVTRFKEGKVTNHRWSPDGKKLALRVQSGDTSSLWVAGADGSHPQKVTQLDSEIFGFDWLPDNRGIVTRAGTSSWDAVLIRDFR